MKKLILLIFATIALAVNAQTDFNKWSISGNLGMHDGMSPSAKLSKAFQIHHFGGDVRYMFNNRIGIMGDVGYEFFDFKGFNTNYFRVSLQGVVNAGDLLRFSTFTKRFGLLAHGGFGFSTMWQNSEKRDSTTYEDKGIKGNDDMLSFIFGLKPQFKINEHWSLGADLSFIFHHNQTYRFDMQGYSKHGAIDGYFNTISIGATYYIGKHKSHADWTPTVYGGESDNSKYDAYESRIKELENQLGDDDNDGVSNARDLEPKTAKDAIVDSKGRTLNDKDGDKVPDEVDMCPDVPGLYSDNGCPDRDKDGVDDVRDKCPDVPGLASNSGCPEIAKEVHEVMTKALKGVQFETGKAILLPKSFEVLDAVVEVMEEHPEYLLEIDGHTDDVGEDEANLILSKDRAISAKDYLISKGIDESRMRSEGYGETMPKAKNDTDEGKALNRRVEFKIVFE